jgi:hypothetical protein
LQPRACKRQKGNKSHWKGDVDLEMMSEEDGKSKSNEAEAQCSPHVGVGTEYLSMGLRADPRGEGKRCESAHGTRDGSTYDYPDQ